MIMIKYCLFVLLLSSTSAFAQPTATAPATATQTATATLKKTILEECF